MRTSARIASRGHGRPDHPGRTDRLRPDELDERNDNPQMAAAETMRVHSVNVGRAVFREIQGRRVLTGYDKQPQPGPVHVSPLGLEGDEQADPSAHGGLSKAVYAYPLAHFAFWQTVRAQAQVVPWGHTLAPGAFGENLTIEGLREERLWIGDRLRLPGCVLAVSEPRRPCYKFDAAMGFLQASSLMRQSGYCGSYLAVIEPGPITAGDAIALEPGPREVNLRELFLARTRR